MSTNLVKSASDTPSEASKSNKAKSSKSSVSIEQSQATPQKELSIYSKTSSQKNENEVPKICECGPDLYTRVLGPTADESILTGLQTIIDLCGKLKVCGDEEGPEREQDIPEKDTSSASVKTSKSQTERHVSSAGFQVNPNVKNTECQTMPLPEMLSQILQTYGLSPEMVSKIVQTIEVPEAKRPSLTSLKMQTSDLCVNIFFGAVADLKQKKLKSGTIQTSLTDVRTDVVQTSSGLLPKIMVQPPQIETYTAQTQSDGIDTNNMGVEADEHKCISPPDPCKCCICTSSATVPKARESKSKEKRPCICGAKRSSRCNCKGKKSRDSLAGDNQPNPMEVKYAITKISKYNDFTTFEVMKSTKNAPKQLPKGTEGVFVLKKAKNSSKKSLKDDPSNNRTHKRDSISKRPERNHNNSKSEI